ncbi:Transposon Ty3-I Gag-Pol polyprotein [Dictyocoela muelleri]|nr:Transposon Ty3-I Gag-Pol polyprotein [Dictyocoela muelleri]
MPFGLCNAPRTFQKAISKLLGHLDFLRVYLDDILILGKTEKEHIENIKKVFKIFKENNITINIDKCSFMTNEVEYLGMIIDTCGIRPITSKLFKYEDFKVPQKLSNNCNHL